MDFNEVVEGVTMYFPVFERGALFMIGDGHAAQGDGEIMGAAIETSFDVQFTVEVIKRSEEHTSELQSLAYLVCRLLLEKKKGRADGLRVVFHDRQLARLRKRQDR